MTSEGMQWTTFGWPEAEGPLEAPPARNVGPHVAYDDIEPLAFAI